MWTLQYFATEHFRQFFIGGTPILYTDHKPLTYLFKNRNTTNAKIARWSAKLSKLRAIVEYRAGAKMGPADTFSRMMKGRPERERRDLETPENREHVYHHRGDLQDFEPEDTKERTISLPRAAGIPQQRVTFLKGVATETEDKPESVSDSQQTLVQHGSIVTEEVVNRMEPFQQERIEVLRAAAKEHGHQPEFRVALAFDVTKIEEGIPSETVRVAKSRAHRDPVQVEEGMFPNTAVVWTTIARKRMSEIFSEATGEYVKDEEEEYLCPVECQRRRACRDRAGHNDVDVEEDSKYEVQCVKENLFQGLNELEDKRSGGEIGRRWEELSDKPDMWSNEVDRWDRDTDSDYDSCEESPYDSEVCRVMGEGATAPPGKQPKKPGEDLQVMGEDAADASPFLEEPDFEKWKEIEQKITEITQKRLEDLSPNNDNRLSSEQIDFINALCDPKVSIVVCQGQAGCGKTFTAMLTACLALEAGLLRNVKQTKRLVSTGGVGLGFERGEMADKLKYRCAPTR